MKEFEDAIKANDASLVRTLLLRYPDLKARIDEPLPGFSFDTPALLEAVNRYAGLRNTKSPWP